MRIVWGIRRDTCFSPGSEVRDEAIFSAVRHVLERRGVRVCVKSEREIGSFPVCDSVGIFSMARSQGALEALAAYERCGVFVINPASGVHNCTRTVWADYFRNQKVPSPYSVGLNLMSETFEHDIRHLSEKIFPCWIKRGEQCSQEVHDVCYVAGMDELWNVCTEFRRRGIYSAVLSAHVCGDLVKFYGVQGTSFFRFFYPAERGYDKFGGTGENACHHGFLFDVRALEECCERVAVGLRTPVYGGDCIVDSEGHFYIIDWNDWPSFSVFLQEASEAIAEKLLSGLKDRGYE